MIGVPSPWPSETAPTPSTVPAGTLLTSHSAAGVSPARVTVRDSPLPTAMAAPGSHGLSEPPSPQVNDPRAPVTGSPPSADMVAAGGGGPRASPCGAGG